MIIRRLSILCLAMAGCAAAYILSRRTSTIRTEKRLHEEDLHAWEGEGGTLAPSEAKASSLKCLHGRQI